jgi:hypothetical protein
MNKGIGSILQYHYTRTQGAINAPDKSGFFIAWHSRYTGCALGRRNADCLAQCVVTPKCAGFFMSVRQRF